MSLFPVFAVPELVVGNYLLTLTQIQLLMLYIFAQRQLYIEVIS